MGDNGEVLRAVEGREWMSDGAMSRKGIGSVSPASYNLDLLFLDLVSFQVAA